MPEHDPATLFYDAECGFCRATAGLVLAWDRRRRLVPARLQDPAASELLTGLSEQQRMASWHLVEPDGTRRSGGAALSALFERLPRGRRLARLAERSPAATDRLYRLTAEHRDRLAKLVPSRLRESAEETLERRTAEGSDRGAGTAPVTDSGAGTAPGIVPDPGTGPAPVQAPAGEPASGFPEPPGKDPGDISDDASPHHALNNPVVDDPDLTEWPDPYEKREDPRDPDDPDGAPFGEEPHPPVGSTSTSEPHPSQDPEAERWEGPKRDKLDQ
jgi:predicted DCC family thiol-disulfide oxidoreductase YuxK